MGYSIKIQRVDRGKTKSFYVNLPAAIAESFRIEKGDEMEWYIEDRDTLVLKRAKPIKPILKNKKNS